MITDPAADGGEWICLHHDPIGVVKSLRANKRHILRNIHLDRTRVLARRFKEGRAHAGRTVFISDMRLVFISEVSDGAQNGIGGGLTESTQCRVLDDIGHLHESLDVSLAASPLADIGEDFQHPFCSLAAGGTLAAGFILAEVHEETRHIDWAHVLVHDDKTAGSHNGSKFGDIFVVYRRVEVLDRNHSSRGTAELSGLEFLPLWYASAYVVYDGPEGCPHGNLDKSDVVDVSCEGKDLGSLARFIPNIGEPLASFRDDLADTGHGFHVVQDARFLPETGNSWEGGPGPWHSPVALNRCHEGRFLSTDEGASALIDLKIKIKPGIQYVFTQKAVFLGLAYSYVKPAKGQRIFCPAINITLVGSDRLCGDYHSFENGMRVRLKHASVHERSRVAFVGVAQDIFDIVD